MKDLVRTIFFWTAFVLFFIVTLVLFIPFGLLKLFRLRKAFDRFTLWCTSTWGRFIFLVSSCPMSISGKENLPDHNRMIYISNHQAFSDIPFLMAMLPTTIGFIAKKELGRVPFIGQWGRALHCIFIDRGNMRAAMRDIEKGIREALDGYPKVIFPEGTRSRGPKMGPFKTGSIVMAAKHGITIVPLTINQTWKTFEEKNRIVPTPIFLTVHPAVETAGMSEEEKKKLPDLLWNTIAGALPDKGV